MNLSPSDLAEILDKWAQGGEANITESCDTLVANSLSHTHALELIQNCKRIGWHVIVEDVARNEVMPEEITDAFGPYRLVIMKSDDFKIKNVILTISGFRSFFQTPDATGDLCVPRCMSQFETYAVRVSSLSASKKFVPITDLPQPRKVVRELRANRSVPERIGPWLLRESSFSPWSDSFFRAWVKIAAPNLVRALASEVDGNDLVFRGAYTAKVSCPDINTVDWSPDAFRNLQAATHWVYENGRELELRHGLFATEIARVAPARPDIKTLFSEGGATALEGARIAYGLSLANVSRDSLKALADLRKSMAEETAKLSDNTRAIVTAVGAAMFTGIGLLAVRLTDGHIDFRCDISFYNCGNVCWSHCIQWTSIYSLAARPSGAVA